VICSLAIVSSIAVLSILCVIVYKHIRKLQSPSYAVSNPVPQGFFLIVNLFVAGTPSFWCSINLDFIQSFDGWYLLRWLKLGYLGGGKYCTLEGVTMTSGELESALWTFIITLNTLMMIVGGRSTREWLSRKTSSGNAR